MDIKKLIAVATGEIHHINNGLCPDFQTSQDSRDDECPACKILTDAAAEHDDLVRRLREAEARVAELEAERAEREAGKLLAYLSNDRTQFFIPSMEGKDVKHAPYMAHWMAGWTPLYAAQIVTAQAEGYVNALRYIAWESSGYMDAVHAAKRSLGEMGALPPPPKIKPARGEG